MTKSELKKLIKECVSEIILSEAIITKGIDHRLSHKEISKNVTDKFKKFYSNPHTFSTLWSYLHKNAKSYKSYYKNLNYNTKIIKSTKCILLKIFQQEILFQIYTHLVKV